MAGRLQTSEWPDRLPGRVAERVPVARLHGYDVENDLAYHYGFVATVLLLLTGKLPEAETTRAFEVALHFIAPAPVSDGPAHCGVLAQVCGAPPSGVVATCTVALAEETRRLLDDHGKLLEWLREPSGPPPAEFATGGESEKVSLDTLRALLSSIPFEVAALRHPLARIPAVLALLDACGLHRADQLHSAIVWGRLPCVLAEGFSAPHGRLKEYPTSTPTFEHPFDP